MAWARILLLFGCFGTGLQRTFCLPWARILLLFECFGTGLQGTCANGFGTSLAPRVPDKRAGREAFCRAAFCLAWARILLLFECFGTGLQGTCANGFWNQPRTEGARQKNCFLWVPKVTGSILSGCVLLGMGSNPAAVRVFRNRPPRDLCQWFRNQPRTEGARQKNCFLWVPKVTGSILSGCVLLGMGSNPAAVRVFRNRPPRDLRQWFRNQPRTEGARQKNCFLWVPKVTGSILSGCVLLGMGSNPAAVRVFRNRPPRDLRQWFRNQLESCCCSVVSEPASKGLVPMVSEPASHRGCQTKELFLMGSKGDGKSLSGCVLLGMGSNPAAVRVFRNRPPRDLRQWFRNQPRTEGARQKNCFLWVPKVTGSILSGCVLLGMGSNPAAVRVFRNRPPRDLRQWFRNQLESCCCCSSVSEPASKGLAPMVSEPASHRGCQTKELFFMGSIGDGKHFVGLRFAWHGLESCCCSSVSEPASKGLAPMVSEPASHRGCQTKELFFMGSKGDGKHFVGLRFAWHGLESCCCSSVSEPASKGLAPMVSEPARILLLFECFGTGLRGTCANGFGTSLAPRVPDKRTVSYGFQR